MDGRLAETQRLPRGDRAAMARDGEKVSEIVPIEHSVIMQFRGPRSQSCGCRGRSFRRNGTPWPSIRTLTDGADHHEHNSAFRCGTIQSGYARAMGKARQRLE